MVSGGPVQRRAAQVARTHVWRWVLAIAALPLMGSVCGTCQSPPEYTCTARVQDQAAQCAEAQNCSLYVCTDLPNKVCYQTAEAAVKACGAPTRCATCGNTVSVDAEGWYSGYFTATCLPSGVADFGGVTFYIDANGAVTMTDPGRGAGTLGGGVTVARKVQGTNVQVRATFMGAIQQVGRQFRASGSVSEVPASGSQFLVGVEETLDESSDRGLAEQPSPSPRTGGGSDITQCNGDWNAGKD